jgi:FkbM family methyltransferase
VDARTQVEACATLGGFFYARGRPRHLFEETCPLQFAESVMPELLRNLMPLSSRIPFVLWRILPWRDTITVRLYTDEVLAIRGRPTLDFNIALEVFVSKIYSPPRPISPDSIKTVVDIGTNVGYALVFLAKCFPDAELIGFEPHPGNARQALANIANNHIVGRTTLNVAAAGVRPGSAFITDDSARSRVVSEYDTVPGNGRKQLLPIDIVDFFETVKARNIDFLKLDCEGGEYDLIFDPRFEDLGARFLVLEWHLTDQHPNADAEIIKRLRDCGWEVIPTMEYRHESRLLDTGVLWGYRV